ncbi:N-alpha-acetyltransferase 50 [Toxocara canis]|uniref:N-terminal methionine N(alpha)-acetyltransferase NatE n=1 Tax=Toxocara canis TaxID=6265 RepID=A0A0B2VTD7_TOXCA|nr:N-alpha-acetyltransferase 50 [Toxocara canis]
MAPSVTATDDQKAPADELSKIDLNASTERRCVGRCDMELGDVTHHNVQQLKRLNQAVFPVSYNDKFYKEIVSAGELAKLAYFNDIVVGGVCCRIDVEEGVKRLYIMTLGTLAPYRRLGIGTLLLKHVIALCEKDPSIDNIYLHVQVRSLAIAVL